MIVQREAPSSRPPAQSTRSLRVLVVDDDVFVARSIRRLLRPQHDVTLALSGRQALGLIRNSDYDVIFCDVMMPEMTGMELHAAVSKQNMKLSERFVFITGGPFTPEARQLFDTVTNPCIQKPFTPTDLANVLEVAIHASPSPIAQPRAVWRNAAQKSRVWTSPQSSSIVAVIDGKSSSRITPLADTASQKTSANANERAKTAAFATRGDRAVSRSARCSPERPAAGASCAADSATRPQRYGPALLLVKTPSHHLGRVRGRTAPASLRARGRYARACCSARQTRSPFAGISTWRTPNGASARVSCSIVGTAVRRQTVAGTRINRARFPPMIAATSSPASPGGRWPT